MCTRSSCCAISLAGVPGFAGFMSKELVLHELHEHASGPKRLEIIEGAEHALRRPEDMSRILVLSLEWFGKHL